MESGREVQVKVVISSTKITKSRKPGLVTGKRGDKGRFVTLQSGRAIFIPEGYAGQGREHWRPKRQFWAGKGMEGLDRWGIEDAVLKLPLSAGVRVSVLKEPRVRGERVNGYYDESQERVVLKDGVTVRTVAHEVGHHVFQGLLGRHGDPDIDRILKTNQRSHWNFIKARRQMVDQGGNAYQYAVRAGLRDYSAMNPGEFFADFYAGWTSGGKGIRGKLKENFPELANTLAGMVE